MKIASEIKRLRKEAGLTQEKLAEELKINAYTLRLYENGSRIPPAETIVAICRRFSVSADWLLDLAYDPEGIRPLDVPEELRAPAEELIGSVLKVCEIEAGRRFQREGLQILRQIVESYAATLSEIDARFGQLVAAAPDFEGQAVPGAIAPELQARLYDQIAEGRTVDEDLRERAQLARSYQDDVAELVNSAAVQIPALLRLKLLPEVAPSKDRPQISLFPPKK